MPSRRPANSAMIALRTVLGVNAISALLALSLVLSGTGELYTFMG